MGGHVIIDFGWSRDILPGNWVKVQHNKCYVFSVTDGDSGKIQIVFLTLPDAWKFQYYISCGCYNNSAIVNPKYKSTNISAKTSSKFKAEL